MNGRCKQIIDETLISLDYTSYLVKKELHTHTTYIDNIS